MRIEHPEQARIPALRRLWKLAFGDEDGFLDLFFSLAYAPERCLCALEGQSLTGMLYWLDCSCQGQKLGYLYAVATDPDWRGRGICRSLLSRAEAEMKQTGYSGALLVPGSSALRKMYEKLGWETVSSVREFTCGPGAEPRELKKLQAADYAALRRTMLPRGSVLQEGKSLDFLAAQEEFFAGDGCLLACHREHGKLIVPELLGEEEAAAGIVAALGADSGIFRMPGQENPFAMGRRFQKDCPDIAYFGLAFD